MNQIPDKRDYVRYALYSAGIEFTEEDITLIHASGSPHLVVDAWIALHEACPAMKAMDEMKTAIDSNNRREPYAYS